MIFPVLKHMLFIQQKYPDKGLVYYFFDYLKCRGDKWELSEDEWFYSKLRRFISSGLFERLTGIYQ